MTLIKPLLALALIAGGAATVNAQSAPAKTPGFREQFLNQLKDVESKVVGLAQAMPEEKYSWRPGEGVRSIGEVYVHIAFANYFLPNFIGAKAPSGISPSMEKSITEKAKVIETVKASFAYAREVVSNLSDADLEKATKFFGQQTTYQGVLFAMANHMHEHLGQSIAYARTNGVVPPWSKKGDS